jgi:hypoxanthine phosphoribosyltransferase
MSRAPKASLPALVARAPSRTSGGRRDVLPEEIEAVLITPAQIGTRVRQLARLIARDHAGRDLVVVALLTGTVLFLADLIRHIELPLRIDFLGVTSYGRATSPGRLLFTKDVRVKLRGRHVLVVDDILDTGRTLTAVLRRLKRQQPREVRVCVLLEKAVRRTASIHADYVGFRVPDRFVVGYGLDFAERYRNLPFIGVLREQRVRR